MLRRRGRLESNPMPLPYLLSCPAGVARAFMPSGYATDCQAVPSCAFGALSARAGFRVVQWLITVVIAICLPLQAVSASVNAVLGVRHTHSAPDVESSEAIEAQDPMSGWTDFRRAQYGYGYERDDSHHRAHESGLRHHHDVGDASVIPDDASDTTAHGPSTDANQSTASFIFMPASAQSDLKTPLKVLVLVWGADSSRRLAPPDPWRIDRPPQARMA